MKALRVEITFPVAVDLTDGFQQHLVELISGLCDAYEEANPGRVMWVFGVGSKITFMPMTREEEQARGLEFDDDTLSIDVSERERYHAWFVPKTQLLAPAKVFESCRNCGIIKNEHNEFLGCRGRVKVELRDNAPQEMSDIADETDISPGNYRPPTKDSGNG